MCRSRFLFIRYVAPAEELWQHMEPYIDDREIVSPMANKSQNMYV